MRMPGRPVGLERVKQLRRERPMSQDELAGAARLSLRTIQGIEGEGIASSESKKALAAVFGVQPETFNDVLTSREVAAAVVDHLCSPRNQFLSDRTLTLVRNGDESTRTTTGSGAADRSALPVCENPQRPSLRHWHRLRQMWASVRASRGASRKPRRRAQRSVFLYTTPSLMITARLRLPRRTAPKTHAPPSNATQMRP